MPPSPEPVLDFAVITPSYAPDYERCRLLAHSVLRFAAPYVHHYIIVDRRDERLFGSLRSARTHLVLKEDIIPWWLKQVPFQRKWWVSLKGAPVRGWMLQQIVKLSVDAVTRADVCIFIDSDTFLVGAFDPRRMIVDGKVPMFREELPGDGDAANGRWQAAAATLLGLDVPSSARINYVTQAVPWRRANVVALHEHMERRAGRDWREAIARLPTVSEYVVYGTFCERVLGERAGHYFDATIRSLNYWGTERLDERAVRALRDKLGPEHLALMISAKSHTSLDVIRHVFELDA